MHALQRFLTVPVPTRPVPDHLCCCAESWRAGACWRPANPPSPPHAHTQHEVSPDLERDLADFVRFSTAGGAGAVLGEPMQLASCQCYVRQLLKVLGWLHRVHGVPLGRLRLRMLLPSPGREGAEVAAGFLEWARRVRGLSKKSELLFLSALVQCAKFLYHRHTTVRREEGGVLWLSVSTSLLQCRLQRCRL